MTLDLEAAELEFGAGPHQCPGRQLAEAIADGVLRTLAASSYGLLIDEVVVNDESRPETLPMARRIRIA